MLNPKLYDALCKFFGGKVKISNENVPMRYKVDTSVNPPKIRTHDIEQSGEQYNVCCPMCRDRRFRLSINHRWGTVEPTTGRLFNSLIWLAHCFNEKCDVSGYLERLKSYTTRGKTFEISETRPVGEEPASTGPVTVPGQCIRLDKLSDNHPAVLYMLDRGFDVNELGAVYGFSYCQRSFIPFTEGRIVIPFIEDGQLVGWQARYLGAVPEKSTLPSAQCGGMITQITGTGSGFVVFVGDTPHEYPKGTYPNVKHGDSVKIGDGLALPVPKYRTRTGTKKGEILYNIDYARKYPYVIVVEGPLDAVRIGPPAVAILGKSMSYLQTRRITGIWAGKSLIVIYDPDASEEMDKTRDAMTSFFDSRNILTITLPDGKDPADCKRDEIRKLIMRFASDRKMTLANIGWGQ